MPELPERPMAVPADAQAPSTATDAALATSRHRTLRSRLLQRLLPPLLLLFVASAALSYFGARYHANEVYDRWLADTAEALAQRVAFKAGRIVLDLPEAARQIVQWDASDTTWFEIRGSASGHLAGQTGLPDPPPGVRERRRDATLFGAAIGGVPVRVARLLTPAPDGIDEVIEVRVAETLRKRQSLVTELQLSILLPQLMLLAVAGVVVWVTVRRLLEPVGRVAEALEVQTHHSLEPVDDRALPAEMVPLTHAMNGLLLRLRAALAAQRDFIADAAHQLRTPLTAIKLHVDELAREREPSRVAPLVGELRTAADRAVRLANQLLTLARAEPSARIAEPRRFALAPVVAQTAAGWIPAALRAGIDLGLEEGEGGRADGGPPEVAGDPSLLAEAIHNLIDNALKYAGRGARVTVAVGRAGPGVARIEVVDDGPGIATADRAALLRRFHRGEPGPAGGSGPSERDVRRDTGVGGFGLGLAIVAEIVRGHDGTISLDAGPAGRGTRVTILLPALPPSAPPA